MSAQLLASFIEREMKLGGAADVTLNRQQWQLVLAALRAQGWISVQERLPGHDGMYFAVREGDAASEMCSHIYHGGRWIFGDGSDVDYPVSYWMPIIPLPAPPTERD